MESNGPYGFTYDETGKFELTGPGLTAKCVFQQEPIVKMVVRFMNLSFQAGRASRDGLREALLDLLYHGAAFQGPDGEPAIHSADPERARKALAADEEASK